MNGDKMPRRSAWIFLVLIAGWPLVPPRSAHAQGALRDFAKPFVVLDSGGHGGPVKSLIFTSADGKGLISAGLDKVVRVWIVDDGRVKLSRTIRPPVWRGQAGGIYALALSSAVDPKGQRMLAVGGFGVTATQGDIGLYAFPGSPAKPDGDVVTRLPCRNPEDPKPFGHDNVVMGLAFTPDGKFLISAGIDGRVLLWDLATFQVIVELKAGGASVNKIALSANGQRLAVALYDGTVELYDINRKVLLSRMGPAEVEKGIPPDPAGYMITNVAITPDGRFVVVGRENGRLTRYEGDALGNSTLMQRPGEARGPIEALAFSPDGLRMGVSFVREVLPNGAVRPKPHCEIQIRRTLDATIEPDTFDADNLIQALNFSPDGRYLAYSGGDDQAIVLRDFQQPARGKLVLKGQGASIHEVAFGANNSSIRVGRPGVDSVVFDFPELAIRPGVNTTWTGALTTWEGCWVEPLSPVRLRVHLPAQRSFVIFLDEKSDRRWWDYSFLPPGPGHPKAAIAVATDLGIVIYRLDDPVRTRVYNGHLGAVYSIAPSPDGRWLVSGSVDQTARLWSLAGCDTLPPLGATSALNPAGKAVVATVAPRGFAEAMGLQVGDVVEMLAVGKTLRNPLDFAALTAETPGVTIGFKIRRGAEVFNLPTTRRDSPILSLFVGADHEWVTWVPKGFYETSAAGDREYLGWHKNNGSTTLPTNTDHFSAEKFEKEFRRPGVIRALFQNGGSLDLALITDNVPPPGPDIDPMNMRPPLIEITEPANRPGDRPFVVQGALLPIRARVAADGASLVKTVRVMVNGRAVGADQVFNPPVPLATVNLEVPLQEGLQKVSVWAENALSKDRTAGFDALLIAQQVKKPTLFVLSVGLSGPFPDARKFQPIAFAEEDAKSLYKFAIAPGDKPKFPKVAEMGPMIGIGATSKELREALARLESDVTDPSDTLVVALESHIFATGKDRYFLTADSAAKPTLADTPSLDEIGEALARIASRGSKVMLLLDSIHEGATRESLLAMKEWVRKLSRRNVIVFVASIEGPDQRLTDRGRGVFAAAVLDTFTARTQKRSWIDPNLPLALSDFQETVQATVLDLSGRKQFASCYVPETLSRSTAIFEPERAPFLAEKK